MEGAFSDMRGALVKAADLQKKAQEGEITQKQLQKRNQALMEELDSLDTKQNQQAGQKVARHAAEYCGLKLG
jgi:Flp pilus assembly protein TadB